MYIDRRAAMEHRGDPSADPDCRNAVFSQLFEGLKARVGSEKTLDYRYFSVFLNSVILHYVTETLAVACVN